MEKEATAKRPYHIAGIDMGIASCGVSLIDSANQEVELVHSHLFNAPENPKDHTSLAVQRRQARSQRRNLERRAKRKRRCINLFKKEGLIPSDADAQWFQTRKKDKATLKLRKVGLDRLLTDREWAQVLYSFAGRRGYIPHGLGNADEDKDGKKVLAAIEANGARMKQGDYRTVGEMLYLTDDGRSRNRGGDYELCVDHESIVDEVKVLASRQRELGNPHADDEFIDKYIEELSKEKPADARDVHQYEVVGECVYWTPDSPEDDYHRKRAAKGSITSEILNGMMSLFHLRIIDSEGVEVPLPAASIAKFMEDVFGPKGKAKLTYGQIRKALDMDARAQFKGIDKDKEKSALIEPKTRNLLRKELKDNVALWEKLRDDSQLADLVVEACTYGSSAESVKDRLRSFWGERGIAESLGLLPLTDAEVEAIGSLPFGSKLLNGYGSRSLWALHQLLATANEYLERAGDEDQALPSLVSIEQRTITEDGQSLFQLRQESRLDSSVLLPPYSDFDSTCSNPVVLRAMAQLRRVVNSLVRRYGPLDEIHIELGRDLKNSRDKRSEIEKTIRQNTKKNDGARSQIAMITGTEPDEVSLKDVRKYQLYKEQGGKDVYSGEPLVLEKLFDQGYVDIDHILPFSRTANDSLSNKVLVTAKSNREKGNRTPKEWFDAGARPGGRDWHEFSEQVLASKLGQSKKRNLLRPSLSPEDQDGFINRNLTDTMYLTRMAAKYLEECLTFADNGRKRHVYTVDGRATAMFRRAWGLNTGAGVKDRNDDRHHGVDAAVVAGISIAAMQRLSKESGRGKLKKGGKAADDMKAFLKEAEPWPSFAEEVLALRAMDIPSRAVSHKGKGQLFEASLYSYKHDKKPGYVVAEKQGKEKTLGNFVMKDMKTVQPVGEQAFLRIWFDPEASKGKGRYLAEPVFYADIEKIKKGTYRPRYVKTNTARDAWPEVPEHVLDSKPVMVYPGDILRLGNVVGRYSSTHIGKAKLILKDIFTNEELKASNTAVASQKPGDIGVLYQDCLGLNMRGFRIEE